MTVSKREKENFLAIDASNIRHGGGITHLSQLIDHTEQQNLYFDKVYLWAGKSTLDQIPEKDWLEKRNHSLLNGNLILRTVWQLFFLKKAISKELCSALFVLGGSIYTSFRPVINFHQNLLPFEKKEIARYGFSFKRLKFSILRIIQSFSMKKSDAIIFLSYFSKNIVENFIKRKGKNKVIYHGIESRFFQAPKRQSPLEEYNENNPFKLIYISSLEFYKHQWHVVEAVASLKCEGFPIELELYGAPNKGPLKKLKQVIDKHDGAHTYVKYYEEINFSEIHKTYQQSDLSIFASSCETFGQIVLESMASGLPIACSNASSMQEIIKDGCVYFDPLNPQNIADSIKSLLLSPSLRKSVATKAHGYAKEFSWQKTSNQTFKFLKEITEG